MQPCAPGLRELPLGPGLSGWSSVLCLFSSAFLAWIQPILVWGVMTRTCCLPVMLFCQLIGSLSYCLGTGYTAGTPYKVPPTQSNTAPPPYSPSPNPYQTAMYPIRSAYPQQNLYAQVGVRGSLGPLLLQVKEPPACEGWVRIRKRRKESSQLWPAVIVVSLKQYLCSPSLHLSSRR